MALPPLWKIKREMMRLGAQIERRLMEIYEPPLQRRHDRRFPRNLTVAEGALAPGGKIAIFVLFQPRGIAASTFLACDYLIANGYAPLLISNAPLADTDRARLLAKAWRVIERPNRGYDFGAYRDGIRFVDHLGLRPDRLIVMNDSTWFPLRANDPAIALLEAKPDPFTGLAYKFEPSFRLGAPHVESHFLMFTREAMASAAYRDFWKGYVSSSSRFRTIQAGEKGLTAAMFAAGFRTEGLASKNALRAALRGLDAAGLRKVVEEAVVHIAEVEDERLRLLEEYRDSPGWIERARDFTDEMLYTFTFLHSTSLFYATATLLHLPYLKKSGELRFHLARKKVLSLNARGEIDAIDPVVLAEIQAAVDGFDEDAVRADYWERFRQVAGARARGRS